MRPSGGDFWQHSKNQNFKNFSNSRCFARGLQPLVPQPVTAQTSPVRLFCGVGAPAQRRPYVGSLESSVLGFTERPFRAKPWPRQWRGTVRSAVNTRGTFHPKGIEDSIWFFKECDNDHLRVTPFCQKRQRSCGASSSLWWCFSIFAIFSMQFSSWL